MHHLYAGNLQMRRQGSLCREKFGWLQVHLSKSLFLFHRFHLIDSNQRLCICLAPICIHFRWGSQAHKHTLDRSILCNRILVQNLCACPTIALGSHNHLCKNCLSCRNRGLPEERVSQFVYYPCIFYLQRHWVSCVHNSMRRFYQLQAMNLCGSSGTIHASRKILGQSFLCLYLNGKLQYFMCPKALVRRAPLHLQ